MDADAFRKRHLAACETTMELTANRRPFLYFPLRHHFEQRFHVRHRLERYGAGRAMEFDDATPDHLAAVIEEELRREVACREVERGGAVRAAAMIAELL
jgi:UDP:flavonoid glycosyltransferase YjiC (YdhE family)